MWMSPIYRLLTWESQPDPWTLGVYCILQLLRLLFLQHIDENFCCQYATPIPGYDSREAIPNSFLSAQSTSITDGIPTFDILVRQEDVISQYGRVFKSGSDRQTLNRSEVWSSDSFRTTRDQIRNDWRDLTTFIIPLSHFNLKYQIPHLLSEGKGASIRKVIRDSGFSARWTASIVQYGWLPVQ